MIGQRSLSTIAVVVGMFSATQAIASHDTSLPMVHEHTVPGDGWTAMRFHTNGKPYFIEVQAKGKNMRLDQAALLLYKADGTLYSWVVNNTYATQDGTYVQTTIVDGQDQNTMSQGTSPFVGIGGAFKLNTNPPTAYTGDLVAVFYAAGADVTSLVSTLRGAAGTALLAESYGEGALLASTNDFFADANVAVYDGSAGFRTALNGSMTMTAEHTLFSFVYPLSSVWRGWRMEVETPSRQVPCYRREADVPDTGEPCLVQGIGALAHGPGQYRYTLTGGGVGQPEVIVGAADVVLP